MNKPELYVEKRGTGKYKVIFLHGFGASRKSFYDLAPLFEKTYELHLIDFVGFGDSKFVPGWDYTFDSQTELLYKYLKENNLKDITIIGNSYGGGVALNLMILCEELKDNSTIKNAVLLGPACYNQKIPFFIRMPSYSFMYNLIMCLTPKKLLGKLVLKNLYTNAENITKEKITRYSNYFRKKDNLKTIIETSKHIIPDNIEEIERKIKMIKIPTLIISGEKDFIVPSQNIERLHRELTNSKLIKLEKTGHMPHEELPLETFKLIDNFIQHR